MLGEEKTLPYEGDWDRAVLNMECWLVKAQ